MKNVKYNTYPKINISKYKHIEHRTSVGRLAARPAAARKSFAVSATELSSSEARRDLRALQLTEHPAKVVKVATFCYAGAAVNRYKQRPYQ